MVEWRILPSIWSGLPNQQEELEVDERPVLLADPSVDSVRSRKGNLDLPRVAFRKIEGREWSLFELPMPGRTSGGVEELELELGVRREVLQFRLYGGPGLELGSTQSLSAADAGQRIHGFLGRHVDLVYGPIEEQRQRIDGCANINLLEFLARWTHVEENQDARQAVIVRIAQELGPTVQDIGERPRRSLRRRREMERVAAVRQIDSAGIRWLVRQPGSNLAERAGPRQRVLAVVREETVDTLENRVMRDLIERCAVECKAWLRDNADYQATTRHAAVGRYAALIRRLRRLSPIADLRRSADLVEPNYVLQHDERYSRVWPWYVKLRRRQVEEDRLWRWSHRTFAEAARLGLASALELLEQESRFPEGVGFERRLLLREEQRHGTFIDPRTALACWLVRARGGVLGLSLLSGSQIAGFEEQTASQTRFAELAPDAVIVAHDPFSSKTPIRFLVVWARLRFDEHELSPNSLLAVAAAIARARGSAEVSALLIEPAGKGLAAQLVEQRPVDVPGTRSVPVTILKVPLRMNQAREHLSEITRMALIDGVGL